MRVTLNGLWQLDLPEHRARRPEWRTGWEKERLNAMFDWVLRSNQKRPLVLDVGTEEGDISALLSIWGADLCLIEPNPKVWANVKYIWDANKLRDPVLSLAGYIGTEVTPNALNNICYHSFPECANGELIDDHGFKTLDERLPEEHVVTIDSLDRKFDMINIDVEGYEWDVLKGGVNTLTKYHPALFVSVHPEFMYAKDQSYTNDMRNWIKNLGYTEELLAYDHELHFKYLKKEND